MLRDAGASYVILGHSERRAGHNEGDESVRDKAKRRLPRRPDGNRLRRRDAEPSERPATPCRSSASQLAGSIPITSTPESLVIAYEPVWAIGTGLTPTHADIADMHRFIRERIDAHLPGMSGDMRILYGGSVKPATRRELMGVSDVDGALVGGASLTARLISWGSPASIAILCERRSSA